MKNLKEQFISVVNEIISTFCEKHEPELDYHIENEVFFFNGGDYVFNLGDITYDMFNDLPKDTIIEWYDYSILWSSIDPNHHINLKSWSKGCPHRTQEQYEKMLYLHGSIEKAKKEFEQAIKELNNKKNNKF